MGARKVVYAEYEGGLVWPWSMKPRGLQPPIIVWADGKVRDEILLKINREKGTSYSRHFTRKKTKEYIEAAAANAREKRA